MLNGGITQIDQMVQKHGIVPLLLRASPTAIAGGALAVELNSDELIAAGIPVDAPSTRG